jgi:hypothetical protein
MGTVIMKKKRSRRRRPASILETPKINWFTKLNLALHFLWFPAKGIVSAEETLSEDEKMLRVLICEGMFGDY